MEAILGILGILMIPLGIGAFICWILIVIKAFKKEESPLMGILCIVLCYLGTLIIGWMNAKKWECKKLMVIFTLLFVVFGIVYGITAATAIAAANELQSNPGFQPSPGF